LLPFENVRPGLPGHSAQVTKTKKTKRTRLQAMPRRFLRAAAGDWQAKEAPKEAGLAPFSLFSV